LEILVIHGVGNPAAGDLVAAVKMTLEHTAPRRSQSFHVTECNWNQIVEPSAKDGAILDSAWEDLSLALARASAIGEGSTPTGRSERLLRLVAGVALLIAELGLAATLAALFIVVPLVVTVFLFLNFLVFSHHEADYAIGVHPALVFAHPALVFAKGCVIVALGGLAALILSGLARALVVGGPAPFFVELRRAIILVLRPFLIGAVSVFHALPIRFLRNEKWKSFFFFLVPALVLFGTFAFVGKALLFDPRGLESIGRPDFATLSIFCALVFGVPMAGVAIVFVTAQVIAPSLKIALDIFRYIGSDTYRKKIQFHLDSLIRRLSVDGGAGKPVVILSHSLGTVIALHSLLSSEAWVEDARITLITLGSPIRRFFMRFFPGLFFPAAITAAADAVAERVAEFKWINCYRPFDQVGGALGLIGLTNARDISTHQWRRIWDAHPNYWGDDLVLKSIARAMLETKYSAALQAQRKPVNRRYIVTEWVDAAEKFRQRLAMQIIYVTASAFIAAPLVSTAVVARAKYSLSVSKAAEARVIEDSGIDTIATVAYETSFAPSARGGGSWRYSYTFTYTSADGEVHESPPVEHSKSMTAGSIVPFEESTYVADMDALFERAKSSCPNSKSGSPPCRFDGVRLRYARDAPEHFVLPDFPTQRTWWYALHDSALLTFWAFMIFGITDYLLILFVGPALMAVVGVL